MKYIYFIYLEDNYLAAPALKRIMKNQHWDIGLWVKCLPPKHEGLI